MMEQNFPAYTWGALYADGSCIAEYDRLEGRGFAEVDRTQVKQLVLLSHDQQHTHGVDIPAGATPIFFRRKSIILRASGGETIPRPIIHCIGWKRDENATYLFISDNGDTLLTDNLQAI